jgi:hypothetical protein
MEDELLDVLPLHHSSEVAPSSQYQRSSAQSTASPVPLLGTLHCAGDLESLLCICVKRSTTWPPKGCSTCIVDFIRKQSKSGLTGSRFRCAHSLPLEPSTKLTCLIEADRRFSQQERGVSVLSSLIGAIARLPVSFNTFFNC